MIGCKLARSLRVCALAAAIMLVAANALSFAASELSIKQTKVTEDAAVIFMTGIGREQKGEAQIGTEAVVDVLTEEPNDTIPVITWLLVDNSLSISSKDRTRTTELITDIVGSRLPSEKITLCTISDHLKVLERDSQSYADLKAQIDTIQYENQETYLTDALYELLDEETKRTETAYVRCIVISDGVDNNPEGITRGELIDRLSENNVPIYTIGCSGDESALKEMYALSRQTGALNWAMSEISDTLSTSNLLATAEIPVYAVVPIPEGLRDGTVKGLRLSFEGGAYAETRVAMPFGVISSPEPTPEYSPEPAPKATPKPALAVTPVPSPAPVSDNEKSNTTVWIGLLAALLAVGGAVFVFFFLRNRKEKNRVRTVDEIPQNRPVNTHEKTEFIQNKGSSNTMLLVGSNRSFMMNLTDIDRPEKHYEVPLGNNTTIGRNPANDVVIDYDNSVSGSHCGISISGNEVRIRDLGSKNGTFVDGNQVVDSCELANGSQIRLGRVKLKVEIR